MYAMNAGSNPVASLQSVSSSNDPNIFTTFDATTTGANITVYNGGSNGGTGYTWRFDNAGNLTLPTNTFAVNYANGTQVPLGATGPTGPTGATGATGIGLIGTTGISSLPSPSTAGAGARSFITDSDAAYNSTSLGNIAVGGGANGVPVYSDGTNWRVG